MRFIEPQENFGLLLAKLEPEVITIPNFTFTGAKIWVNLNKNTRTKAYYYRRSQSYPYAWGGILDGSTHIVTVPEPFNKDKCYAITTDEEISGQTIFKFEMHDCTDAAAYALCEANIPVNFVSQYEARNAQLPELEQYQISLKDINKQIQNLPLKDTCEGESSNNLFLKHPATSLKKLNSNKKGIGGIIKLLPGFLHDLSEAAQFQSKLKRATRSIDGNKICLCTTEMNTENSTEQEPSNQEDNGQEPSNQEDNGQEPSNQEDNGQEPSSQEDNGQETPENTGHTPTRPQMNRTPTRSPKQASQPNVAPTENSNSVQTESTERTENRENNDTSENRNPQTTQQRETEPRNESLTISEITEQDDAEFLTTPNTNTGKEIVSVETQIHQPKVTVQQELINLLRTIALKEGRDETKYVIQMWMSTAKPVSETITTKQTPLTTRKTEETTTATKQNPETENHPFGAYTHEVLNITLMILGAITGMIALVTSCLFCLKTYKPHKKSKRNKKKKAVKCLKFDEHVELPVRLPRKRQNEVKCDQSSSSSESETDSKCKPKNERKMSAEKFIQNEILDAVDNYLPLLQDHKNTRKTTCYVNELQKKEPKKLKKILNNQKQEQMKRVHFDQVSLASTEDGIYSFNTLFH